MKKLTEHESNAILKTGSGYDNAIAMEFANPVQKARHSARVLEIEDMWSNLHAMEFATNEQKKRHRNRVLEIVSGYDNAKDKR